VDHVFTGIGSYPIEFAFAYRDTIEPSSLRTSLEQVLEDFWPLRSKLTRLSDRAYGLCPAEDGLVFRSSRSSAIFEEAEDVSGFVDSVRSVEGEPLARIRLTQTPHGSVLGVSVSHALVDGFSLFHFLASWSSVIHGQRYLKPTCERTTLMPKDVDPREPVERGDILAQCGLFWAGKRQPVSREQIREERLLVPRERIDQLCAEAQQACGVPLFPNDVLSAYLWRRCITQWETGEGNPRTYLSCPVEFRRILRAIPRTYFGNALCLASASADYTSLTDRPIWALALLIRQAVSKVKPDYVSGYLRTLERLRRQEGLSVLEEIHVVPPEHGMLVTNIARLPVRDLDFGAGLPTAIRALSSSPRTAAILPAEDGVDIRVYHPVTPD
jgi:hypothetical protein